MFRMSAIRDYYGPISTLRFPKDRDPRRWGLGVHTDVDGQKWRLHGHLLYIDDHLSVSKCIERMLELYKEHWRNG